LHIHPPSSLLSLLFSFCSPVPHPSLHSFPTRRSSDLVFFLLGLGFALYHWKKPFYAFMLLSFMGTLSASIISVEAPQSLRTAGKDRKSTRLNSSHLGISYAVFCLKKKKQ